MLVRYPLRIRRLSPPRYTTIGIGAALTAMSCLIVSHRLRGGEDSLTNCTWQGFLVSTLDSVMLSFHARRRNGRIASISLFYSPLPSGGTCPNTSVMNLPFS
jgi:hypothetical protein